PRSRRCPPPGTRRGRPAAPGSSLPGVRRATPSLRGLGRAVAAALAAFQGAGRDDELELPVRLGAGLDGVGVQVVLDVVAIELAAGAFELGRDVDGEQAGHAVIDDDAPAGIDDGLVHLGLLLEAR